MSFLRMIMGASGADPWFQQQVLLAGATANRDDFFGPVAISADGGTCVVGAAGDDSTTESDVGSAHVFVRVGGVWALQQRLLAGDGTAFDQFGVSVAISANGNTCVVGANIDDNSGGADAGSAYVFTRSGGTWTQQQRLQAADAAAVDYFGISVALSSDGNTCLVGAPFDDNGAVDGVGSAYVFTRSGTTWTQQQKLQASDPTINAIFGYNVSLSADGNTCVVAAERAPTVGDVRVGAAYVFTRSGGTWTQQQKLLASDAADDDRFGVSVSLSPEGNTLLVGAYFDDNTGGDNAGAAYVFTRSGSVWTQRQKLTTSDGTPGALFGFACALSSNGDVAVVGAGSGVANQVNSGTAYVFSRSGTTWTQQQKLQPSNPESGDGFGVPVAVTPDGKTVLVGATQDDNIAGTNAGAVYVFVR